MIDFYFKSDFIIEDKTNYVDWINRIISSEGFDLGNIDYIFCSDDYLLGLNLEYLNHDTLTDIITFDYTNGKQISGDIFISTDRVAENAESFAVGFSNELLRVMSHGLLHLMGYGDKTEKESAIMRQKEEEKMQLFHVEP
ncbi:rRNA maturation RNase YbeY [Flagellimonas beolgyonensis]|uniref:rRNA maturation RNase YbeY n=1 Tax=Flagellimonas beolgyonensis TaxID=864064 RepID=UPI003D648F08